MKQTQLHAPWPCGTCAFTAIAPPPIHSHRTTSHLRSFPLYSSTQHTTTIYLNDQIAEYAKELTDRMPGNLKVAYFVNSGRWAGLLSGRSARVRACDSAVAWSPPALRQPRSTSAGLKNRKPP